MRENEFVFGGTLRRQADDVRVRRNDELTVRRTDAQDRKGRSRRRRYALEALQQLPADTPGAGQPRKAERPRAQRVRRFKAAP